MRRDWTACWALPLTPDGLPEPLDGDVLHAPTAAAEQLSLPARLVATVPLEPDRRRVRPGPAAERVLAGAAAAYVDLVRAVPPEHRLALVPESGFPRSELDGRLRELLFGALRGAAWLPAVSGAELAPGKAEWLDLPEFAGSALARRGRLRPAAGTRGAAGPARRTCRHRARRAGRAPHAGGRAGAAAARGRAAGGLVACALRGAGTGRRHRAGSPRRAAGAAGPARRRAHGRRPAHGAPPGRAAPARGRAARRPRPPRAAPRRPRRGAPAARPARCGGRRPGRAARAPGARRGRRPVAGRRRRRARHAPAGRGRAGAAGGAGRAPRRASARSPSPPPTAPRPVPTS